MYISEKGVLDNSNIYFNTPSNIAKSTFFYSICVGEFFCNGDYRVERKTFNSYLLMYIKSGSGTVHVDGRTAHVHANDVVILDCHHHHEYCTKIGWEILWLHFDGNFSKNFFELINNCAGVVIAMEESIEVHHYLTIIIEGFKCNKLLPESLVSSHIHRMLTELLLISSNSADYIVDRNSPVLDAVRYINLNFNKRITVEGLSSYVNISIFHFSRIFKNETGYSPYEYIIKTRIDHAKALLKQTKLNIKEIAYEVGYNSESNFVNTFHKSVSLTPSEFRNAPI